MKLNNKNQQLKRDKYWKYYWRFFGIFTISFIIFLIFRILFFVPLSPSSMFYLLGITFFGVGIIAYKTKYYNTRRFNVILPGFWGIEKEQGVFDKKAEKFALRMIIFSAILIIIGIFVRNLMFYRSSAYYPQYYDFIYFRDWHIQEVKGSYFNGLVISQNLITDTQDSYERGGFIRISSSLTENNENNITSVKEYIAKIKELQTRKMKAGDTSFEIPGASQFEYLGNSAKLAFNEFKEISSLATLSSNTTAYLYWRIVKDRLYEINIKYPQDNSKIKNFETGMNIFRLSFGVHVK